MEKDKAKTAHTSGPWLYENVADREGGIGVFNVKGASYRVAVVPLRLEDGEREANAALIAAAPDLLACLRRMCGMYSAYSRRLAPLLAEDEGTIWTFERANSLALEAIAKAEASE